MTTVKTIELPLPEGTILTRVLSDQFFNTVPASDALAARARQLFEAMTRVPPEQAVKMLGEALLAAYRRAPEEAVAWTITQPHPLVEKMSVVRMFDDGDDGVTVYSVSEDGMTAMRNRIPATRVRLSEEAMPIQVLVEEIREAESDNDDDGGDDEDDSSDAPAEPPPNVATSTNGRAVS